MGLLSFSHRLTVQNSVLPVGDTGRSVCGQDFYVDIWQLLWPMDLYIYLLDSGPYKDLVHGQCTGRRRVLDA